MAEKALAKPYLLTINVEFNLIRKFVSEYSDPVHRFFSIQHGSHCKIIMRPTVATLITQSVSGEM